MSEKSKRRCCSFNAEFKQDAVDLVVKQVYEASRGICGSYKIDDRLRKDDSLEAACRNIVAPCG